MIQEPGEVCPTKPLGKVGRAIYHYKEQSCVGDKLSPEKWAGPACSSFQGRDAAIDGGKGTVRISNIVELLRRLTCLHYTSVLLYTDEQHSHLKSPAKNFELRRLIPTTLPPKAVQL